MEILTNIANAFIYTLSGMSESKTTSELDAIKRDNRFMYMSILIVTLIFIGIIMFNQNALEKA
jgi:hypothetical protein